MCSNCGYGDCEANSTICICNPPFVQSKEFFLYPSRFDCDDVDYSSCMPCHTHPFVLNLFYLLALLLGLCVVTVSSLWTKDKFSCYRYWPLRYGFGTICQRA